MEGIVITIILGIGVNIITYYFTRWKERSRLMSIVHPIDINPWKVTETEKEKICPEILVATFSGIRCPRNLENKEFEKLLETENWAGLGINEDTPSIGQTIKAIKTYPTLKKVYLITTQSQQGPSSMKSVSLFKTYVKEEMKSNCEIIADVKFSITMDEDAQVTKETYDAVKLIFSSLGKEYTPKESKVLVDITGGTKSMTIGALLACIRPDQNVHVIGTKYDEKGDFIKGKSFPMIIEFKPEGLK